MDTKEELLDLINKYIAHIKKNYDKKNPFNIDDELSIYIKENLNLCIKDYINIVNFEIKKIEEFIPDYNKQDIRMLEYYQVILRDTEFELQNEDLKIIKKILSKLNNNIDKYMKNIDTIKIEREKEIIELVKPYQDIIDKINNNNILKDIEVKNINDIIKVSNLNIDISIKIMRYLYNYCFGN